jgi:hypothetical protein
MRERRETTPGRIFLIYVCTTFLSCIIWAANNNSLKNKVWKRIKKRVTIQWRNLTNYFSYKIKVSINGDNS